MRLKPHNPGRDICVASGCKATSALSLGADTAIGRQVSFKVEEDIGICDEHWTKHCLEEEKAVQKQLVQKMAALESARSSSELEPRRSRKKRSPVPKRT